VLGVWDGHDAGAAIVVDRRLVAAVNEERFSRRKLEVRFPAAAIAECLTLAGVAPGEVDLVAVSTSDVAKTLTRLAPWTKERYYQVRRRLRAPGSTSSLTRAAKSRLTELGSSRLTRALSRHAVAADLSPLGLAAAPVRFFDHHLCHAAGAALSSGMPACAVVTIDGVGDGLSSTVSRFERGGLTRLAATPASESLGIFFEHVTTLLNMRELEDEGKVMALADYAAPVADTDNPMLGLVRADGLRIRTAGSARTLRRALRRLHWRHPNEQFAAMAQRTVERVVADLAREACRATGLADVAMAGGVASNVKANRRVRLLDTVANVYVFPHMGDGGLAAGAAAAALLESATPDAPAPRWQLDSLALGSAFTDDEAERALSAAGLPCCRPAAMPAMVADLLAAGRVVFWCDGPMEFGPRALGQRSVLSRADRPALRDRINLVLKRRVWFQPFCPSILESDARQAFDDWKGAPDRFMTMAYLVGPAMRGALAGVVSVDGTCRPQIVPDDAAGDLAALLREMRGRLGVGAVLNTSLNLHGEPMVRTPAEAASAFLRSGADALRLGPFLTVRPAGA
jgi:carbamoyltransferase